jgi:putative transposase
MPNHIHGIIIINNEKSCADNSRVVPTAAAPTASASNIYNRRHNNLSKAIGAFKTTSSKQIHQAGLLEFAWHRSFYDHIIRDEEKLKTIRKYIKNNPIKLAIYKGLV